MIATLTVGALLIWSTDAYQRCMNDKPQGNSKQRPGEEISRVPVSRTYWTCTGYALDEDTGVVTGLGTLAIALFTLTLWLSTRRELAYLERQFNADHRPWVAVEVELYQWLLLPPSEDGCIYAYLRLRNTGNAPASRVLYDYTLVRPQQDPLAAQRILIARLESQARDNSVVGISVFPGGHPATEHKACTIDKVSIAEWRDWYANHRPPMERHFTHLAGCVVYRSPGSDVVHHTGFIRELHLLDRAAEPEELVPLWDINPNQPSTPSEFLRTRGSPLGGGMID